MELSSQQRMSQALGYPLFDPDQMGALHLAYVGDTVYDLYVRAYLVNTSEESVHRLHQRSARGVCAQGQARAYFRLAPLLTAEEEAVFRRGRNAHSGTVPKHAHVGDYRIATGLEALIGYLWCLGREQRLDELMAAALPAAMEGEEGE